MAEPEPGTSGEATGKEEAAEVLLAPPEAKKPKKRPEVIVVDSGSDDDESQQSFGPAVKTADLSAMGLVDVVEEDRSVKHGRTSLARMQHNRYGRPLGSLVRMSLVGY